MIGEDIYNGLYANPDLRGTITTAQGASIPCICSGIDKTADNSALGQVISNGGMVRLLSTNEPSAGLSFNNIFTLTDARSKTFTLRIIGYSSKSGMTSLTVEAIHK